MTVMHQGTEKRVRFDRIILASIFLLIISFISLYFYLTQYVGLNSDGTFRSELADYVLTPQYTFHIDESVDVDMAQNIRRTLTSIKGYRDVVRYVEEPGSGLGADIVVNQDRATDSIELNSNSYLVVDSIYSVRDYIDLEELCDYQYAGTASIADINILFSDCNSLDYTQVEIKDISDLVEEDGVLGVIPASNISSSVKVLAIDEGYYLEDQSTGTLDISLVAARLQGSELPDPMWDNAKILLQQQVQDIPPPSEEILSINMNGVVAISRNLAIAMEKADDPAYPAKNIGEFLGQADLTHVSNEVSFVEGCVPEQSLRFCSAPRYIETLKASGVDIIELTGNHNNDYGWGYSADSIKMYDELGWEHFGGGVDIEDASTPLIIEEKGSRIAFLGYNYFDTVLNTGGIATERSAGANTFSLEKMESDIKALRDENLADVIVVTLQFQECFSYPEEYVIYPPCYEPLRSPDQRFYFRQAVDFGADIVVGTQAHQPQTYELYKGNHIYYGLGNLFFDQRLWPSTRQGLSLMHYFSKGEHIQTRIYTTLIDDKMQPFLTDGDERLQLLNSLNAAR